MSATELALAIAAGFVSGGVIVMVLQRALKRFDDWRHLRAHRRYFSAYNAGKEAGRRAAGG